MDWAGAARTHARVKARTRMSATPRTVRFYRARSKSPRGCCEARNQGNYFRGVFWRPLEYAYQHPITPDAPAAAISRQPGSRSCTKWLASPRMATRATRAQKPTNAQMSHAERSDTVTFQREQLRRGR